MSMATEAGIDLASLLEPHAKKSDPMRTVTCRNQLGDQVCTSQTIPDQERWVVLPDRSHGVHYECENGHKFHCSSTGETSACDCPDRTSIN